MSTKRFDGFCHFVFVCQGKDCSKHGSKAIQQKFSHEIKSQGLKSVARVINTKCTDRCKEAPAIIIKERWLGKVKEREIPYLVSRYLKTDKN